MGLMHPLGVKGDNPQRRDVLDHLRMIDEEDEREARRSYLLMSSAQVKGSQANDASRLEPPKTTLISL